VTSERARPVSVLAEYQPTWWHQADFNTPTASPFFHYNFRRKDDVVQAGSERATAVRRAIRADAACRDHPTLGQPASENLRIGRHCRHRAEGIPPQLPQERQRHQQFIMVFAAGLQGSPLQPIFLEAGRAVKSPRGSI
jgi:hypothetical protein